jgi:zinc protease
MIRHLPRIAAALAALSLVGTAVAQTAAPVPATATAAPANPQTPAARAWGFAVSDVPVDPDIRFGVLPNGMKYALHRNATPRGVIILRLQFDIGALAEAEDQRGLAHFLEHMAFNGSTNVPEGEMVRLLERKGLSFGADTNASTGFDTTTYQLDLPQNTPDLIDTGLMLFRETASELTIAADAVDRERGVILSERRARDTYGLRNLIDGLEFLYDGTLLPQRLPIGAEAVIRTAPAQRIRDFYDAYYRPERATLVVTGDMDVDAMEGEIRRRFADWQGRGANGGDPVRGTPTFERDTTADIFVHPAIGESVSITALKPWTLRPDTMAERRQRLFESVAEAIISRRLSRIALATDAPFSSAGISESNSFDVARALTLAAQAREGSWPQALAVIENEYRRAVQHGFTQAEVDEVIANLRTGARNAVAAVATRNSAGLANRLLGVADGRTVATAPAATLAIFETIAPDITPDAAHAALRAMVADYGPPLVRVTARAAIDGGEGRVLAALQSATAVAVTAPEARAAVQFAYTDFGTPGRVIADDRIDDLGIRRIRFANNVMLNMKRTDFEDDRIRLSVRIDGGTLLAPREDPTRVALASLLSLGGLEAHSSDELRTIFAGRTVSLNFGSSVDAFVIGAATTPADFAYQAQVSAAMLTHPGYRPEAIDLFRRVVPQQYAANDATPAAVIGRDAGGILADNDPRLVTPQLETVMALDWEGLKPAIADSLTNGAIEIGVVGALDEAAVIEAIAATFGALPARRAAFDPRNEARVRSFASDRSPRTLLHKGEADQAIVQSYWQARDDADLGETIRLELLGEVMGILLTEELRERLGQTYSPSADTSLSSDFPGYGYIVASSNVDFADVAATEAAIAAIATQLRDAPVSDDIVTRARTPFVERLTRARRDNSYWIGYVGQATSDPALLDRSRNAIAQLQGATAAELQMLARRYLTPERMLTIRAIAATAGTAGTAGTAPASAAIAPSQ